MFSTATYKFITSASGNVWITEICNEIQSSQAPGSKFGLMKLPKQPIFVFCRMSSRIPFTKVIGCGGFPRT